MSNELTQKKQMTFSQFLTQDAIKNKINSIVGSDKGASFVSGLLSAVTSNPTLSECSQPSLLNCALLGSSLNLSPSPQLGMYYMVPYENTKVIDGEKFKVKEAQFQLGWKGYVQLALRTGQYKNISAISVKEGELKSFNRLTDEVEIEFIENDAEREKAKTIGYIAYFKLINGFEKTIYWSKEKMEAHADKYSKAFSLESYKKLQKGEIPEKEMWKYSSYWYKDFDGMAYKTLIRQLISKWGIMSTEMELAFRNDMAVIREDNTPDYIDNQEEPVEKPITIGKEKIIELAKLVGEDGSKLAIINEYGYETINQIEEKDYDEIYKKLGGK